METKDLWKVWINTTPTWKLGEMQGMMYFPSGNFFFKQYSNQWKLNIVMRAAHIFLTAIMKPETHCYTLKIYSGQIFKCQVHASFLIFNFFCFLGRHVEHMEVPSLGVKSELQLPAYTTAIAMWNSSCVSVTYTTAHSNVRYLIHWGRPRIKSGSSRRGAVVNESD